jgi:predicted nuclease of restriction endonuclease-like (RecB) superfamily
MIPITQNNKLHIDQNYKTLLISIKSKLQRAQLRAAIHVNTELIQFYWEVGKLIILEQAKSKWGDKLFDALASDLSSSFPGTNGFSKTNLKNMHKFALHYSNGEFSQSLPDQLTWTHHMVLLQSIDKSDLPQKQWYAAKVIENGWSYRELKEQNLSYIKDSL